LVTTEQGSVMRLGSLSDPSNIKVFVMA
jgi:hypothetical protein